MPTEPKKANVRDAFRRFTEENKILSDSSDYKARTRALARFYVEEIHNPLHARISDDDYDRAYVDAGSDLGVDIIHCDDNTVLIVQVKYAQVGAQTTVEVVEHFRNVLLRLMDGKHKPNALLHDALLNVNFDDDTFVCRFITLGRIDGQARTVADSENVKLPRPGLDERVTFEFLDEGELTEELRNALSFRDVSQTTCDLVAHGTRRDRSQIIELEIGDRRSWVLVVAASQLVELYKRYRDRLFILNVRLPMGATPANKAILETARDRPEQFFHLNNGISCIATKVNVNKDDGHMKAEGFQVINGAQTIRSLYKAREGKGIAEQKEQPAVLVRVTEVEANYSSEGRFRNDIIRANNTQNAIRVADFRSNDSVQEDLKKQFAQHTRLGKKVVYVPKRTDKIPPGSETIRIEEFAKTIYGFMHDPVSFSTKTGFLFDDTDKGGYRHVFGDGRVVWDLMPPDEFKLRSAIWWLAQAFGKQLKEDRNDPAVTKSAVQKNAQEQKWKFVLGARLVLESEFGFSYREHLSRYYRGEWTMNEKEAGKWFNAVYQRSRSAVIFAYEQAAKRDGFVSRNWMRDVKSIDEVRDAVEAFKPQLGQLPPLP